jgi:two-component sensor histidine kinase
MGDRQFDRLNDMPEGFIEPPLPVDEPQRLIALKRYDLLDTPPEEAFDRITRLAAGILGMPISLITLVDETRQWFKSRHGFDASWTRREISFCAYTILDTEGMVIRDATEDERFQANPLVTGGPNIRFYAGVPLVTPENRVIGTLCVIDRKPHPEFTDEQQRHLQDLADLAMAEIEAKSGILALRQEVVEHQETERLLHRSLAEAETLLREVHHRVKNNLQVVDTLLALQMRQTPAVADSLRDLRHRVHCLGIIHHKIMQSPNLETIKLRELLQDLCQTLASLYKGQADVSLNVTVEPGDASIKIDFAITLGLLITELVTNASKHVFATDRRGTIDVSLTSTGEGKARLAVSGSGADMSKQEPDITMGQQIIAELVDQLDGVMDTDQKWGTGIAITFPCPPEWPC